jgi:hypothetical protein
MRGLCTNGRAGAKRCAQQGQGKQPTDDGLGWLVRVQRPWIPDGEARHGSRARPVAIREQGAVDAWGLRGSEGKRGRKQVTDTWGCHGAWVGCVAGGGPG